MTDDMPMTSKTDQAVASLRAYFTGGAFQPGARLPSEAELTTTLGISRVTVRRALARLRDQRVIRTDHGRGSYVINAKPAHTLARTYNPWDLLQPTSNPQTRVDRANTLMAELFGIGYLSPVYVREQAATYRETGARVLTVRTVAANPILDVEPAPDPTGDRAPLITAFKAHCGPLTARVRFRYIARPRAETAAGLGLEPGAPIVEIRHLTYGRGQLLMVETEHTDAATTLEWDVRIEAANV